MTKEQAKQIVKGIIYQFISDYDGDEEIELTKEDRLLLEVNKTICNAIDSLEELSSDDCVSRKRLMDNYNGVETPVGYRKVVDMEVIKNMPPVTPTQSWIPVITREPTEEEKKDYFEQHGEELCYMIDSPMPDNGQEVLVSGGGIVTEDIFNEDFWNFENWDIENVEAWMPLPKPYEEKRGDLDGI